MTPDSERRLFEGCMYGIAKGRPRCHQCCGGQGICGIQVEDGAVHAFRQTEIIGIDDEAASYRMRGIHAPSLASAATGAIDRIATLPYTRESLTRKRLRADSSVG